MVSIAMFVSYPTPAPPSAPGFPDKFVRYSGRRLFVHSRKDDPDVEFKALRRGVSLGKDELPYGYLT